MASSSGHPKPMALAIDCT